MRIQNEAQILPARRCSAEALRTGHADSLAARNRLRALPADPVSLRRLRGLLAADDDFVESRDDDEALSLAAGRISARYLAVRLHPRPPLRRPMTGYFTMFKFLKGQSLAELESRIGYRKGRLTTQGLLLYKFLRVPEVSEFQVAGTSVTPQSEWDSKVAPERARKLAAEADYHKVTKVPTFDETQRKLAQERMSIVGDNMLVKIYPLDWQPIDDTAEGYPHGSGIPQWRLTDPHSRPRIEGSLFLVLEPGEDLPKR